MGRVSVALSTLLSGEMCLKYVLIYLQILSLYLNTIMSTIQSDGILFKSTYSANSSPPDLYMVKVLRSLFRHPLEQFFVKEGFCFDLLHDKCESQRAEFFHIYV